MVDEQPASGDAAETTATTASPPPPPPPLPPPSRHAYLGALEDVTHARQSYYAHGEVVALPLILVRDLVLFPGEELPLRMLSDDSVEAIREQLAAEGVLLAVMSPSQGENAIGTTVRVERFSVVDNCASITGAAKQRFRVQRIEHGGLQQGIHAHVEIIADLAPPRPPFPLGQALDEGGAPVSPAARHKRRRGSPLCRLPCFWGSREYALFDSTTLIRRIQDAMIGSAQCNWFRQLAAAPDAERSVLVSCLTRPSRDQDPVRFAYWIATNLPLDHAQRQALLGIESIVDLLRMELTLLEELEENIFCARCGLFLSQTREIFSVSNDGATGTFVNPGGHVHQIITLREIRVEQLYVDTMRSTEDSWFPGYAWSLVHCGRCFGHLGWQFNHTEPGLVPPRFYGLRRTALTQKRRGPDVVGDNDDADGEATGDLPGVLAHLFGPRELDDSDRDSGSAGLTEFDDGDDEE